MIELLAENNFGDTRSGGLAGPTGLLIILLLVVGTILLIRNMNARLRRLPDRFEHQGPAGEAATTRAAGQITGHAVDRDTGDGAAGDGATGDGASGDRATGPAIDRRDEPR